MAKDFAKMDTRGGSTATRAAMRDRLSNKAAHAARLEDLAPNPLNPRYSPDDPETQALAHTMSTYSQYQALVVVERKTFVAAYPETQAELDRDFPAAKWVIVIGNRRYAAARLAEMPTLDIRISQEIRDAEAIDRAMLVENLQRRALPPLPEAEVLQRMVSRPGASLRTVAEEIGMSHTYVGQRIALLDLIPEFKVLLQAEDLPIKTARSLAIMDQQEQRALLNLIPEFKVLLQAGDLPIKTARSLAAMNQQEQHAVLDRGAPYVLAIDEPVIPEIPSSQASPSAASAAPRIPLAGSVAQAAEAGTGEPVIESDSARGGVNPVYTSAAPDVDAEDAPEPGEVSAAVNPVYTSGTAESGSAVSNGQRTRPATTGRGSGENRYEEQPSGTATSFEAPAHDPQKLAVLVLRHYTPAEIGQLIEALTASVGIMATE